MLKPPPTPSMHTMFLTPFPYRVYLSTQSSRPPQRFTHRLRLKVYVCKLALCEVQQDFAPSRIPPLTVVRNRYQQTRTL
jgi:hypothetical protein